MENLNATVTRIVDGYDNKPRVIIDENQMEIRLIGGHWSARQDVEDHFQARGMLGSVHNQPDSKTIRLVVNPNTLTPADARLLGKLTTKDESGTHFTQLYNDDFLSRMEGAGYIEIHRPVHAPTLIAYGPEEWSVEVTEEGREAGEAMDWGEDPAPAYRLELYHWTPADVNLTGYNAWYYLPTDAPDLTFPSREAAEAYQAANHKGPDDDGVSPVFRAVQAE